MAQQKVIDVPQLSEAEKFVEALCSERSNNCARLQEEKDALMRKLKEVEIELARQHDELRVGNELMDVLAKNREREMTAVPRESGMRTMSAHERYERETGIDTLSMPERNH